MSRVLRAIPLGKRRGLLNAAFRTPAYPGDAVVTLQTPATLLRRRVCRCGLLDERAGLYPPSRSSGLTRGSNISAKGGFRPQESQIDILDRANWWGLL